MRYTILNFFVAALFAFPFSASADVRINEIAWMGGNGNANCEWIELYNNSDTAVDIAGWSFTVNGTKNATLLANPGELVLDPYGYYVIARKFGTTAASATTCHPYFESFGNVYLGGIGALNNTSLSVSLFDPTSASPIDSVATSINWSEYSKANTGNYDTVQRSGDTWSLGAPTPAGANTATVEPARTTTNSTVVTATWDKDQIRSLSINAPDTLSAGIPFTFSSITSPKDARKYKSHTWNFGDFTTSKLSSPTHTYLRPGTYLVHLIVDGDTPLELTKTITVVEPSLHVTRLASGDLTIRNDGGVPLDLSFCTIVGTETFRIPEYSTLLAGAALTIPAHLVANAYALYTADGQLLASVAAPETPKVEKTTPVAVLAAYTTAPLQAVNVTPLATSSPGDFASSVAPLLLPDIRTETATKTATSTPFPAYFTLAILLVIAVGASLIKTRLQ